MKYVRIEGGKKLSSFVTPMMAQLSDLPAFDSPEWVFEIKWDGYRAIAEINKQGTNRLYSRNGLTFDKAYPKVYDALKSIKKNCIVDGEIVVFDDNGKPSFQRLQNYQNKDKYLIQFYVFDLIEVDGKSVTSLPLIERKERLQKLIPDHEIIRFCEHIETEGKALFKEMTSADLEGMIAKRKNSKYYVGKRTSDWLKIKHIKTQEAIIIGFTDPKGSRSGFGSLLLAVNKNGKLVPVGNVGTGFTDKSLKELHTKLKGLTRKTSPLDAPVKEGKDVTWVDPVLVCNIKFTEITEDGSIRHPVFQGLRVDKTPKEVVLEKAKKTRKKS
jgi:bifunctional non-homologous end joining protein LigD